MGGACLSPHHSGGRGINHKFSLVLCYTTAGLKLAWATWDPVPFPKRKDDKRESRGCNGSHWGRKEAVSGNFYWNRNYKAHWSSTCLWSSSEPQVCPSPTSSLIKTLQDIKRKGPCDIKTKEPQGVNKGHDSTNTQLPQEQRLGT